MNYFSSSLPASTDSRPVVASFRKLLKESQTIPAPILTDGLSIKMAESLGFRMLALGGYGMGSHYGLIEPLLSLDQVATCVRNLRAITPLPVFVDAGTGGGTAIQVQHTVRTLEAAGASAIALEDQVFPKRAHYHRGLEQVVARHEYLTRISAAISARRNAETVIIARTDSVAHLGYDEAIARIRAAVGIGAEMATLFPSNDEEARRAPKDLTDIPLLYVNSVGGTSGRPVYSIQQLTEMGWRVVVDPASPVLIAAEATEGYLRHLLHQGESGIDTKTVAARRTYIEEELFGLAQAYSLEEREFTDLDSTTFRPQV